eukprot:CAMPEP_0177581340 /NCGR_PEP_ID=MMETSP0419_2-20121207/2092_1 /TAXON_ID=582737 /ORGANISM="Tetraselmis sp., Strain GSL018" /LENGTH=857 /DNA_ID=CAMNT_0019070369 /DNA_START=363 /DNA_END=2936 /DNA_ORIENTATION=+
MTISFRSLVILFMVLREMECLDLFYRPISLIQRNNPTILAGSPEEANQYEEQDTGAQALFSWSAKVAAQKDQESTTMTAQEPRMWSVLEFLRQQGYSKVATIHEQSQESTNSTEVWEAAPEGMSVRAISLGSKITRESISSSLDALQNIDHQVVLVVVKEWTDALLWIHPEAFARSLGGPGSPPWIDVLGTMQPLADADMLRGKIDNSVRILSVVDKPVAHPCTLKDAEAGEMGGASLRQGFTFQSNCTAGVTVVGGSAGGQGAWTDVLTPRTDPLGLWNYNQQQESRRIALEGMTDCTGSCCKMVWIAAVIGVAGILVLQVAVLSAVVVYKRKISGRGSQALRYPSEVCEHGFEIQSPLAKLLYFLERYEKGNIFSRPSRCEAGKLRALVMQNSHRLAKPLGSAMKISLEKTYSHEVVSFLTSTIQSEPESSADSQDWSAQLASRSSSFNIYMPTMSDNPNSFSKLHLKQLPPLGKDSGRLHIDPTHFFTSILRRRNSGHSFLADEDCEIVPNGGHPFEVGYQAPALQPTSFSKSMGDVMDLADMSTLPREVILSLGRDLNFDFITKDSPLKQCQNPLMVVVKSGIGALRLGRLLRNRGAEEKLMRFAARIEEGYADMGFHCKLHAADVTNRMITIMEDSGITYKNPWTRLAALVSAALHDYQHPQMTNSFLVAQEDNIAQQFNDQAVVENFSIREGLRLLHDDDFDFVSAICSSTLNQKDSDLVAIEARSRKLRHTFRKTVIQTVLATDMSRHFDVLEHFKANVVSDKKLQDKEGGAAKWAAMTEYQQSLTLQVAMKVSDIGHCALPFSQHKEWVLRLQEEMFAQAICTSTLAIVGDFSLLLLRIAQECYLLQSG